MVYPFSFYPLYLHPYRHFLFFLPFSFLPVSSLPPSTILLSFLLYPPSPYFLSLSFALHPLFCFFSPLA
ncbi:hypothetical protein HQ37_07235 [Porphyromonas sp. COT-239 OH1446]|nr:hypothetical protein HQ37_07235 [Porphyromonas sp. COT-239 OH1446]